MKKRNKVSHSQRFESYRCIHYNRSSFISDEKFVFGATEVQLDVLPCSKYVVKVHPISANGTVLRTDNFYRFRTSADPRSAPANARKRVEGSSVVFSWESSCQLAKQPLEYRFTANDLVLKKTTVVNVSQLWYRYENVQMGGVYNFSVSTTVDGAQAVSWEHKGPPLPAPSEFHIVSNFNDSFSFEWKPVNFNET